jgi:hypothetical protein
VSWADERYALCTPSRPCGHCNQCVSLEGAGHGAAVGYLDERRSPLERMRSALLDTAAVRALPAPKPLIEEMVMRDSLALLYSQSGAGKTFLAVDWSLSVATGSTWHGHQVHQGPVLYVLGEGVSGIGSRIDAWCDHRRVELEAGQPIHWLPQAVNLMDLGDVYALAELVGDLRPDLVVVDTLARCSAGAEENSARDIGLVVAHLDVIRRTAQCCVLVLHHAGKDGTLGARGSSALRAAVDTELELAAADDRVTLKVTKQKDGAEADPVRLRRIPAASSVVLELDVDVADDDRPLPSA